MEKKARIGGDEEEEAEEDGEGEGEGEKEEEEEEQEEAALRRRNQSVYKLNLELAQNETSCKLKRAFSRESIIT